MTRYSRHAKRTNGFNHHRRCLFAHKSDPIAHTICSIVCPGAKMSFDLFISFCLASVLRWLRHHSAGLSADSARRQVIFCLLNQERVRWAATAANYRLGQKMAPFLYAS